MRPFFSPWAIGGLLTLCLASGAVTFFLANGNSSPAPVQEISGALEPSRRVIGTSVQGRAIEAYTYGTGDTRLLFVGGIHGGYEWNSVLLAYRMMDYFTDTLVALPKNISVTVIPSANPDGVFRVIGKEGRFAEADVPKIDQLPGRFNARGVDLNRNFDCKWKPKSKWRDQEVSAGDAPFSEPESRALRDFILEERPKAVVYWHSQANAVYASECEDGVLPKTIEILREYSKASGYPAVESFEAYEVTGDTEGWLASIGIPAISVELSTHETIEWKKNLAGVQALIAHFAE